MSYYRPLRQLATHEVTNQPPPLEDYDLHASDPVFAAALARESGDDAGTIARVQEYGRLLGQAEWLEAGDLANRHAPELIRYDRYGERVDEARFHPSYHRLMGLGIEHEQHAIAWNRPEHGHVAHAALEFLMHQVEAGVCCPLSMTYAGIPALRHNPALAKEWEPRLRSREYDPRCRPAEDKRGATLGMAMTEKQGGSDVRANSTKAKPLSPGDETGAHGLGPEYELVGHKWFCSAPMSDAFLTLAWAPGGLTCFFVPRWKPDGSRNALFVERLKDKLGNRSNASSEIEYHGAWAVRVGEEGRGVPTIIEMVHHTRLDTTIGAASLMRRALVEALHHARHRRAFQKRLVDQALMRNVLADMAIESEAATVLAFRVARAFDESATSEEARAFSRLAVALAKYWLNKRVVGLVYEALECHGGVGYVEEAPMARLYREAPLNGIWEGSGNVIALDALRTFAKAPDALDAWLAEIEPVVAGDRRLAPLLATVKDEIASGRVHESVARRLVERMALLLQASLLVRHSPPAVTDAFIASRLAGEWGHAYGTLPDGLDLEAILARAFPES
ncbi:MAG: DNA alkylation response protein [Alphaproteobacteria bacterium]|nr:MAG: DNA alkylation response protein [Alphaproteobacteria bacterium]